mmetsp:Transcript_116423/g.329301  ORF Transcript_116423/g.329301 Transcript_116423/m.329301 type:complete len:629 (-) Transcript_116423:204-2090(-)
MTLCCSSDERDEVIIGGMGTRNGRDEITPPVEQAVEGMLAEEGLEEIPAENRAAADALQVVVQQGGGSGLASTGGENCMDSACSPPDPAPLRRLPHDESAVAVAAANTSTTEFSSCEFEVAHAEGRSREKSWRQLPQKWRGISLREILDFHALDSAWIQSLRWQCKTCRRPGSDVGEPWQGCPSCTSAEGQSHADLAMRNLYEVNDKMIMPRCRALRASYVELLRFGLGGPGHVENVAGRTWKAVDAFVSHWWGMEFHKFVKTLDRFACSFAGVLNWTSNDKQHFHEMAFWICAFCNNQFAVQHALGQNGDVTTSSFATALEADSCKYVVAVLDKDGHIYRRIWCAFELFYVTKHVPRSLHRELHIALANENGVVSHGDGTMMDVLNMRRTMEQVKTSEAEASFESDRKLIEGAMRSEQTSFDQLDSTLKELACVGVFACTQRRNAVVAVLGGSAFPSLAYDLAQVLDHIAKMGIGGHVSLQIMRVSMVLLFGITFIVPLAVIRGLPRLARHGSHAHCDRLLRWSIWYPANLLMVASHSCHGRCSRFEWTVERKLWFCLLCLALLHLVLTIVLFSVATLPFAVINAGSLMCTMFYIMLGALYQSLREFPFFTRFRRWVEHALFSEPRR